MATLPPDPYAPDPERKPDGTPYPQEACPLLSTIQSGENKSAIREVMWSASGEMLPLECSVRRIDMDGGHGAVITSKDLRPQYAAEASVRSMMQETAELMRQRDAASRVEREHALEESIWQRDLAARVEKVATDKIREQQELLEHVVNGTSIGIAVLNDQLRFRWYNRSYQSLVGRGADPRGLHGEDWLTVIQATPDVIAIAENVLTSRQNYSCVACDN